jgi:NAD(P)-dependent dehydrogenase (short-subunit alcohol dehydrogenase family)
MILAHPWGDHNALESRIAHAQGSEGKEAPMLRGKRIVVVGGTHGIGFGVARRAADEGAEVVIASSRRANVDAALAKLPKGVTGQPLDVRDHENLGAFFQRTGAIDHLVYTAGESLLLGPLAELDFDAARRFFEVRYWGALATVRAARPHLGAGASIVLSGGAAARRPPAGFVIGASVCGAMESVTRVLALELAPVRVNIVVPGFVDTELWSNVEPGARAEMFREAAAKLPVKRIGTPDDLAEYYLAFMRGAYATGQSIVVDGGGMLV